MTLDPGRNIIITPGSDSALYFAMLPFLEEGDEVIVPSPCYPNNLQNIEMANAKAVYLQLKAENEYQIDAESLKQCISPKTKMIVLTHPNNPTTTVFNAASLEAIREAVLKHDLVLVCDQAFQDFTFENEMIAPAAMEGMFSHTVTVCSASKGFGLSGYRVGWIIADDTVMDVMYGCAVSVIGATHTASQQAVIAAFDDPSFMDTFRSAYDIRRHAAVELLDTVILPCAVVVANDGTQALHNAVGGQIHHGKNYGPGGERGFRIVLGVYRDNERVIAALKRIRKTLLRVSQEKGLS